MEATNEILIAKMHTYILNLAQHGHFILKCILLLHQSMYSVNPQFRSPTHNARLTDWVLSNGTEVEQIC